MTKEEKELVYKTLKSNPSMEPIADLMLLVENAKAMAKEAYDISNKLSVFATKAEAGIAIIPAIEPWMELCDFYKVSARDFGASLADAIKDARLNELPQRLKDYNDGTADALLLMAQKDPKFKELFRPEKEG